MIKTHKITHAIFGEEITISLRLKQLVNNRQDHDPRMFIEPNINNEKIYLLSANWREVMGIGPKNHHHCAKQPYFHGIPTLIEAIDRKEISIAKAARITEPSSSTQEDFIQVTNPRRKLL